MNAVPDSGRRVACQGVGMGEGEEDVLRARRKGELLTGSAKMRGETCHLSNPSSSCNACDDEALGADSLLAEKGESTVEKRGVVETEGPLSSRALGGGADTSVRQELSEKGRWRAFVYSHAAIRKRSSSSSSCSRLTRCVPRLMNDSRATMSKSSSTASTA